MSKKILIFGASTASGEKDQNGGWAAYLRKSVKEKYGDDYTLYNLAISGDTTGDILRRFEFEAKQRIKKESEGNIILIMTGTNDIARLIKEDKFRTKNDSDKNIQAIIDLAKKYAETVVFIENPLPDDRRTCPVSWNENLAYKKADVVKLNNLIKDLCDYNKLSFVSLGDFSKLLEDGLHPNSDGHQKIFTLVLTQLKNLKVF